jgi:long-subunit acyl-CoA synthetase (AMP-forming)
VAGGELTPSLKVRRSEVFKRYADEVAAIYV